MRWPPCVRARSSARSAGHVYYIDGALGHRRERGASLDGLALRRRGSRGSVPARSTLSWRDEGFREPVGSRAILAVHQWERPMPDDARKAPVARGHEGLGFAQLAGVEQHLSQRGMARRVLVAEPELQVSQGDRCGRAAPMRVDDAAMVLQDGAGPRRVFLREDSHQGIRTRRDLQTRAGRSFNNQGCSY